MKVNLEISEADIREIIANYLSNKLGDIEIDKSRIFIQVKSKQNYKSEWETAYFKAEYIHETQ